MAPKDLALTLLVIVVWSLNFALLVPLVGLTTGWLVFHEALQTHHLAGGTLLMAGLWVNVFGAALWQRWRKAD